MVLELRAFPQNVECEGEWCVWFIAMARQSICDGCPSGTARGVSLKLRQWRTLFALQGSASWDALFLLMRIGVRNLVEAMMTSHSSPAQRLVEGGGHPRYIHQSVPHSCLEATCRSAWSVCARCLRQKR